MAQRRQDTRTCATVARCFGDGLEVELTETVCAHLICDTVHVADALGLALLA